MPDAFCTSGSSPTEAGADFRCENHEAVFLLLPLTPPAHSWIKQHLPANTRCFGNAVVVEHRYIWAILEGIQADGLKVCQRTGADGSSELMNNKTREPNIGGGNHIPEFESSGNSPGLEQAEKSKSGRPRKYANNAAPLNSEALRFLADTFERVFNELPEAGAE